MADENTILRGLRRSKTGAVLRCGFTDDEWRTVEDMARRGLVVIEREVAKLPAAPTEGGFL